MKEIIGRDAWVLGWRQVQCWKPLPHSRAAARAGVVIKNPHAAISSSLRQNLSAKDASKRSGEVVRCRLKKTSKGREKKETINTNREELWEGKADNTRRQWIKSGLRGYTSFLPWLIKSGHGSGQPTAHFVLCRPQSPAAVFWFTCTDWQALAPFNCFSDGAGFKAESGIQFMCLVVVLQHQMW